jgi:uncharacterized protein
MRVRIDEIPDSGRSLAFHWDQQMLGRFVPPDDPFKVELLRPVNVLLQLDKHPDHVRITGSIKGTLQVSCHRCLKPFAFPLDEQVDIYLVTEAQMDRDDEKELDPDEMLYEFFDGEVIEVDRLVAEQIFLALPVKVLCSEDCRGICPGCGANLNEEPCRCAPGSSRSPFAGLRLVKKPQSEE